MDSSIHPARLDTVIIATTRMSTLVEFYRQGLGLPTPQPFGDDHMGFQLGEVYLGFDQVAQPAGHSPGAVSFWFRVDDLQRVFDHLVSLGARVNYPPTEKPWGDRLAAVFDLDDNLIGLAQRR